jgi:hypothetical protein
MTINGNFKFFEPSKALFKNSDTVVASSGVSVQDNLIDFNKTTRWESIGTDDTTTETLTFTFNTPTTISRILLLNHNFMDYTIAPTTSDYILDNNATAILDDSSNEIEDDGGTKSFINVVSMLSSTPVDGISETGYTLSNSYYEFTPTYATGFIISCDKAQPSNDVPDQEKYCYRVVPTEEVNSNAGTFEGYPSLQRPHDFFGKRTRGINGKFFMRKLQSVFTGSIVFSPGNQEEDLELVEHLRYRAENFIFWPNGGNLTVGETTDYYFRFEVSPYKVDDIFLVQIDNMSMPTYINNIYINPYNLSFGLREVN